MTKRKTAPKRTRGVAIQIYVSPDERADIRAIARKRDVTISTLVRDWIRRSTAAALAREREGCADDPRQLALQPVYKCTSRTCPGFPYQAAHPCAEACELEYGPGVHHCLAHVDPHD